jgi:hypothetical protein
VESVESGVWSGQGVGHFVLNREWPEEINGLGIDWDNLSE